PGDLRNIDQHAAPENGRNRIDSKALEASRVALHARRFLSTMQPAVTTEVTERIDVRAHMRAQRDSLGSRTSATGIHVIPMLLVQPVQKWRMRRMVRHAGVIMLREVNRPAALHRGDKLVDVRHQTSVPARSPKNFRCSLPFSSNTKASESKSARSTSRTIGWHTGRSGSGYSFWRRAR